MTIVQTMLREQPAAIECRDEPGFTPELGMTPTAMPSPDVARVGLHAELAKLAGQARVLDSIWRRQTDALQALHDLEAAFALPVFAAAYANDAPPQWQPGETKTYTVTLTNTGGRRWPAHGDAIVRLSVHFGGDSDDPHDSWATDERFNLPHDVLPRSACTLTVVVTAPSQPGDYVLRHRIVKENVAWCDQVERIPVTIAMARDSVSDILAQVAEDQTRYNRVIEQVRAVVRNVAPPEAMVAVASKGDERLVQFEDHQGWHFPCTESGVYAGHHPTDSADAIARLEKLQQRGVDILAVPNTAFWWLNHYDGLHAYLQARGRLLWQDDYCIVYALSRPTRAARTGSRQKNGAAGHRNGSHRTAAVTTESRS